MSIVCRRIVNGGFESPIFGEKTAGLLNGLGGASAPSKARFSKYCAAKVQGSVTMGSQAGSGAGTYMPDVWSWRRPYYTSVSLSLAKPKLGVSFVTRPERVENDVPV